MFGLILICLALCVLAYVLYNYFFHEDDSELIYKYSQTFESPHSRFKYEHKDTFQTSSGFIMRTYHTKSKNSLGHPTSNPKAIVVFITNVGSTVELYAHINSLAYNNYEIYAMDHIGCGESEGKRGHMDSYEHFVNNVHEFISHIKEQNQQKQVQIPMFLCGDGIGATIAMCVGLMYPSSINGLLLCGPLIRFKQTSFWDNYLHVLDYIAPYIPYKYIYDIRNSSKNGNVVYQFTSHPGFYKERYDVHTFNQILLLTQFVNVNMCKLMVPYLALQGLQDAIADCFGAKDLIDDTKWLSSSMKHAVGLPLYGELMLHNYGYVICFDHIMKFVDEFAFANKMMETLD